MKITKPAHIIRPHIYNELFQIENKAETEEETETETEEETETETEEETETELRPISSTMQNNNLSESELNDIIEKTIENKVNKIFKNIKDNSKNENKNKMIHEYTIHELYINTMQYLIDVINDISDFLSINHNNISNDEYRIKLFNIFLSDNRKLYCGIVLIFLSLILYFVDGIST